MPGGLFIDLLGDGVRTPIPSNVDNVWPELSPVTFTTNLVLTNSAHHGREIINIRGAATVTTVEIKPSVLPDTFFCWYVQESTTEITKFIVPTGKVLNGVTNGAWQAFSSVNSLTRISIRDGKAYVRGSIYKI